MSRRGSLLVTISKEDSRLRARTDRAVAVRAKGGVGASSKERRSSAVGDDLGDPGRALGAARADSVEALSAALTGRPRVDLRRVVDAIIFRMRSGCQWNRLPERFGSDSTVHRWFQRFVEDGVLEELWATLVSECEQLGALDWS